jgi:hypothetical protein
MKKYILFVFCFVVLQSSQAQFGARDILPASWHTDVVLPSLPFSNLVLDSSEIRKATALDRTSYICGIGVDASISSKDFRLVRLQSDGSKIYQYRILLKDALGMRVHFKDMNLPKGAYIWIYKPNRSDFVGRRIQRNA